MWKNRVYASLAAATVLAAGQAASAQPYIMMPDSSGAGRIMLFQASDGTLVDANFIVGNTVINFQTPKSAFQVGNEIWVTDQIDDSIFRFTATVPAAYIGKVSGQLDNIRGGGVIGTSVWIANDGSGNGATADSFGVYDFSGNRINTFSSTPATSPFDAVALGSDVIAPCSSTHDLYRYSTTGTPLGTFHDSGTTGINFPQQVIVAATGAGGADEVWAAGFSSRPGVYRYSDTGTQLAYYNVSTGLRGVNILDNGDVIYTDGDNVKKFTPPSITSTTIVGGLGGGAQYLHRLVPTTTPGSTNPYAIASASPNPVAQGNAVTLSVTVTPGTTPASTGLGVTVDLTAFGGSATQALTETSPGSNVFTYSLPVPLAAPTGNTTVSFQLSDAQGRTGSASTSFFIIAAPPAGFVLESEPNDTKALATIANISSGFGVFGVTTGTSTTTPGIGSADNFRITTPLASPGIYRHRMVITSPAAGHTGTIRGLTQTSGSINTTDTAVQTSTTTTSPARMNQWYGFGRGESVYYRVTGGSATTSEYTSTLTTDVITPEVAPATFTPGPITISRAGGATGAYDILVYDAAGDAVGDALNESTTGGANSLTRTYPAGTYYVAVSNVNTADNRAAPTDSNSRSSSVLDFPNAIVNSSTTTVANMTIQISDGTNTDVISLSKTEAFQVNFVRFQVGSPSSVCCRGTTSILTTQANCTAPAGVGVAFLAGNSTVNGTSNTSPCCYADFNKDTSRNIDDIFIYLNAWFAPASNPFARIDGDGSTAATIDDLFVFINVWFAAGCG